MSEHWHVYPRQEDETGQYPSLELGPPPPWRNFADKERLSKRGHTFQPSPSMMRMVNAALLLRRPLLVTGPPGTGKSSLAHAVAENLGLGHVLKWSITSKTQFRDGIYTYDAIGRLQDSNLTSGDDKHVEPIQRYVRLGPLGSALADSETNQPRVLLIDEIDKSDIDLPNDLLNIFEEGRYVIPELARLSESLPTNQPPIRLYQPRFSDSRKEVTLKDGLIDCQEFPFVILTSNGERDLPPAFLRRCLRLDIRPPREAQLRDIVLAHFKQSHFEDGVLPPDIDIYVQRVATMLSERAYVPVDHLLNAIHMVLNGVDLEHALSKDEELTPDSAELRKLADEILRTIR